MHHAIIAIVVGIGVSAAAPPKHFVVTLVDDLGGYNVPWRNPENTMADDLVTLSTQEGMRLENFYTFKFCSPTRSSFLTARFPCHVNQANGGACPGCNGCDGGGIDLRMKLLPQKLGNTYRSYMVGKGHLGNRDVGHLPINRGFDYHLGFLGGGEDHWQCNGRRHSCDGNASSTNGVHCECETTPGGNPVDLWQDHQPAYGLNGTYSCNLYSGKAVALIEDHAAHYPDKGMFLYLPYHDVHEPYEALDSFRDPALTDSGRQTMQAMVGCVSEGTGNVTRALKAAGMWETTLFLWSSDNGGPQYWLGNNYPLRGGKGTDFEGGVATAAFVTGGALPSHLYGQASNSPIHLVDLHFTICLLAGVNENDCRDDHTPGIPPVDGVDLRIAFETVNVTRPVGSNGAGPSAGTQEIVLSTTGSCNADRSLCGAYIDFNVSNGGPWKYVANTSTVIKNAGSPLGSGYWTPAKWPVGNDHTPSEPDHGCPEGGCLFNLRLDRSERQEFSSQYPEVKARMIERMRTLMGTTFQSDSSFTGGYDNCQNSTAVANGLHGFAGVCCTK